MSTEIQSVTFEDAAQKLREQIKSAFVELIPEEQWNAMVKTELEKFFEDGETNEYYARDRKRVPPRFHTLVREIFDAECKERIADVIRCGHWHPDEGHFWEWGHLSSVVSSGVKQWLTENAERLLVMALQGMIGTAAQHVMGQVEANFTPKAYDPNDPSDPRSPNYRGY